MALLLEELEIHLLDTRQRSGYDQVNMVLGAEYLRNRTGSVHSADLSDISDSRVITIDQYFQGRIPGMWVSNHSGMPGDGTFAIMRGVRSMNQNLQPLYILSNLMYY